MSKGIQLVSHTTGVTLRMEGEQIRIVETATGRPFRRMEEVWADLTTLVAVRRAAEEELAFLRHDLDGISEGGDG